MTALSLRRPSTDVDAQRVVDAHFVATAGYWDDVYAGRDVQSAIYRARRATVLRLVDELNVPPTARILEIGCGAGWMAVALAGRGRIIDAVDAVGPMIASTRARARAAGVTERVRTSVADAHQLPFADGSFDVVVAVGLVPWVAALPIALGEMTRVLAPGGHAVLTADNRWRVNHLLDPRWFPPLTPLRAGMRAALDRLRHQAPRPRHHLYAPRSFDRLLASAGLRPVRRASVGFGPFTFGGLTLLGETASVWLHERLQRLAERGTPGLRRGGAHYIVVARREGTS